MKIEIEKKDLLQLISKAQNIVEKRNTMAVLVNVLLEAENGKLFLYATDLEVSLKDSFKCNVIEEGKIAVNAKNLFEIIKELKDGKIFLNKNENHWLTIKQEKYVSKMVGIKPEEYPVFPSYNEGKFFNFDSKVFLDMIDKTLYSVSNDETRYYLNGVYFELNSEKLTMVATDGHRLALINKENQNTSNSKNSGVIIPKKGLIEIKKMVENFDQEISILLDNVQIVVKNNETVLLVRLIDGKYPNYQQFIPQKTSKSIVVSRDVFLSSLKRVSLLANQKSKAVTLHLTSDKMDISSNNPELGDAKEEIEVKYSGPELKIGFNAKYLTDVLTAVNENEILIELNDQLSPGLIKPNNDKTYTCVVMPMRI